MTRLLEDAITKVRKLPESEQDEAAEILLVIAARNAGLIVLDEATRQAIGEGLEQAERGALLSAHRAGDRHAGSSRAHADPLSLQVYYAVAGDEVQIVHIRDARRRPWPVEEP